VFGAIALIVGTAAAEGVELGVGVGVGVAAVVAFVAEVAGTNVIGPVTFERGRTTACS
jgi:hypothetical protein